MRTQQLDGDVLDAEQWSRLDNTLSAVQSMLREVDDRIQVVEITGPQNEPLLLIRHPDADALDRDEYMVARNWDWILPRKYGQGVSIVTMQPQKFTVSFEPAPT